MSNEVETNETELTEHEFFELLLSTMRRASLGDDLPAGDTPLGQVTREFFANNWAEARDGLLAKAGKIEVIPELSPAPRVFQFRIHCPYKRKNSPHAPVKLVPGPVRGTIYYRADLLDPGAEGPPVAVALHDRGTLHPNYSRRHGLLCIGGLEPGPMLLGLLLEHIYRIVTYQNLRITHPADVEAAAYFATEPDAMQGLEHVEPLY